MSSASSWSVATGVGRGRFTSGEGERVHVADLAEERHHRQPHEPAIVRDHGLHGQERSFAEHHDHRLLGGGEVAHHRHHADHERALRRVGDERLLAIEERDLGCLQHVAAAITLGGFDQEEGFDVAEDGEAKGGTGTWHRSRRTAAPPGRSCPAERNVQVGRNTPGADIPTVTLPVVVHGLARRGPDTSSHGQRRRRTPAPIVSPTKGLERLVDVVVDVEVEVDADPLEEVVVQRDEADFDGHLQVLQPAELFEQVDDLFVDLLRLADDQARGWFRTGRSNRDRPLRPRWSGDGGRDQFDQACRSRASEPPPKPPGPKPLRMGDVGAAVVHRAMVPPERLASTVGSS